MRLQQVNQKRSKFPSNGDTYRKLCDRPERTAYSFEEISILKENRKRCSHNRTRYCPICHPHQLCVHKRANHCRICHPHQFCIHGKRRCQICSSVDWAKMKIDQSKRRAKKAGYAPINIDIESVIKLMKEAQVCVGCEQPLDWQAARKPCLHHNHETGEVIGFVHNKCNWLEGLINRLGYDLVSNLVKNLRPRDSQ